MDPNGHKHILVCRILVGNYTTGQHGMKVPLWKMTKSDWIQWQITSTHPHNSSHSMTLIHESSLFGDGVYTSTTFSYSAQETILSSWSQWSQTYPGLQGLGWELYNRTAGNESTPMKNDKIRFNSVTDSIDTPTQFITFHDAHTQKCTVRGWRLHFNNIFLLCPRTILSSWSQWSQTYPGSCRVLVGNYTTGQQGMKVPLWKMTKSDLIQWQIPSTHPHNSSHSMTLIHKSALFGDGVYTSTTFSYSAQELFSPVDHNGHKHILVCRVLVGNYTTGQQGMKVPLWKMYKIRYNSVTDSIDTPTQFITFHDAHILTKVHCSGMASTLQQHFLTLPKNYSLQLITMVTNIYPGLQGL